MALPINPDSINAVVASIDEHVESDTQYGKIKVVCLASELDGVQFKYTSPETAIPALIALHRYGAIICVYSPEASAPSVDVTAVYHGTEYTETINLDDLTVGATIEFTKGAGDDGLG